MLRFGTFIFGEESVLTSVELKHEFMHYEYVCDSLIRICLETQVNEQCLFQYGLKNSPFFPQN